MNAQNGRGFGDTTGAISNYRNSGLVLMEVAQHEPPDPELQKQLESIQTQLAVLGAVPLPAPPLNTSEPSPVSSPPAPPLATSKEVGAIDRSRKPASEVLTPTAAPVPVPSPEPVTAASQPAAVAEIPPELNQTIQRYTNVSAKIGSADSRFDDYKRDLAKRGLSVKPDIESAVIRMNATLQLAKDELDHRDLGAAKASLDRAGADANRVLTFFGR